MTSLYTSIAGRVLEDNAELKNKLSEKALPKKEYFEFTTDDGEGTETTFL